MMVLAARVVPPVSLIVPFYLQAQMLNVFDTHFILIMTHTFLNMPFAIWIIKSFFDGIPSSLIEAARIDGCSEWRILWKVVLPISKPGIAAASIITFLWSWNEFMFALTLTQSRASRTLPVGINDFVKDVGIAWTDLAAAGIVAAIPAIFFLLFFQKWIIKGLQAVAVKA